MSGAHIFSSRAQLWTSGLGQTTSPAGHPLVEQQPQRQDRLGRLAQPHLVGEQRACRGIRNAIPSSLILERLEGHFELPAVEESVERRLQQAEQPVLEQDRVGGRPDADAVLRRPPLSGSVGQFRGVGRGGCVRRERRVAAVGR
jgi:hypothetical protein